MNYRAATRQIPTGLEVYKAAFCLPEVVPYRTFPQDASTLVTMKQKSLVAPWREKCSGVGSEEHVQADVGMFTDPHDSQADLPPSKLW